MDKEINSVVGSFSALTNDVYKHAKIFSDIIYLYIINGITFHL